MNFYEGINPTNDNKTKEEKFRDSLIPGKNKQRPVSLADAKEFIPKANSSDYRVDRFVIEAAREHEGNIEDMMK